MGQLTKIQTDAGRIEKEATHHSNQLEYDYITLLFIGSKVAYNKLPNHKEFLYLCLISEHFSEGPKKETCGGGGSGGSMQGITVTAQ